MGGSWVSRGCGPELCHVTGSYRVWADQEELFRLRGHRRFPVPDAPPDAHPAEPERPSASPGGRKRSCRAPVRRPAAAEWLSVPHQNSPSAYGGSRLLYAAALRVAAAPRPVSPALLVRAAPAG